MTITKNEISPELAKIRDEKCPVDLHFRKECDENSFRCGAKISWKEGFNDAVPLTRQRTIGELAARAPEFDFHRIQSRWHELNTKCPLQPSDILVARIVREELRQMSLHYEAVIEKLKANLKTRNRTNELEALIKGHMEAMRPLLDEWTELRKQNGTENT
jgi:hypothetical protein